MQRLALFATPTLLAGRFARALAACADAAAQQVETLRRRSELRALLSVDDHMLGDIGLSRRDVVEALRAPSSIDPTVGLAVAAARRRAAEWSTRARLRLPAPPPGASGDVKPGRAA